MSRIMVLRCVVEELLSAAVEQVFREVESTVTRYEEELHHQRLLLEALQPERRHTGTPMYHSTVYYI